MVLVFILQKFNRKEVLTMKDSKNKKRIEIFCKYIVRKGKKIYPKNKSAFRFLVEKKVHVKKT